MKTCAQCNKGSQVGGGYSNRVRAMQFNPTGNRRRHPNLQWAPLPDGRRVKICTRCIKRGTYVKNKEL
ncbi:MAG: L28 family ribosomal protein [bacterium]|nr:L28 family ribosomal protein [bacterium]